MNNIFKHFITREEDGDNIRELRRANATWFVTYFPIQHFQGLDKVFYSLTSKASKFGLDITNAFLDVYIDTELKAFVIENKIIVDGVEELSFADASQANMIIREATNALYAEFEELEGSDANPANFKIDMLSYIDAALKEGAREIIQKSYSLMDKDIRESTSYLLKATASLNQLYNEDIVMDIEVDSDDGSDDKPLVFCTDFGIESIDKETQGCFGGRVYGIEAATGIGKTRFALGTVAYRTMVLHKKNVIYFALEQDKREIRSMLVSTHIYNLYGKQIPSKYIEAGTYGEELEEYVQSARLDLFKSGKYGKLLIVNGDLYLDTFIDIIQDKVARLGNVGAIFIDYIALIEQSDPRMIDIKKYTHNLQDYEVTGRAYRKFKQYIKKTDIAGFAINQFNKEGTDKSMKGQMITSSDIMGGLNGHRSIDYSIAFLAPPEMVQQNKLIICNPKVRNAERLDMLTIETRLGCCLFWQSQKGVV